MPQPSNVALWFVLAVVCSVCVVNYARAAASDPTGSVVLMPGETLYSDSHKYSISLEGCNLNVYKHGHQIIWLPGKANEYVNNECQLSLDKDGSVVIFSSTNPLWVSNTGTSMQEAHIFVSQDDGILSRRDENGQVLVATLATSLREDSEETGIVSIKFHLPTKSELYQVPFLSPGVDLLPQLIESTVDHSSTKSQNWLKDSPAQSSNPARHRKKTTRHYRFFSNSQSLSSLQGETSPADSIPYHQESSVEKSSILSSSSPSNFEFPSIKSPASSSALSRTGNSPLDSTPSQAGNTPVHEVFLYLLIETPAESIAQSESALSSPSQLSESTVNGVPLSDDLQSVLVSSSPSQLIEPRVKSTPASDVRSSPVQSTPASDLKNTPVKAAPQAERSNSPVQSTPADDMKSAPVKSAPQADRSNSPVQSTPADDLKSAPVKSAPEAHRHNSPVQSTPADDPQNTRMKSAPQADKSISPGQSTPRSAPRFSTTPHFNHVAVWSTPQSESGSSPVHVGPVTKQKNPTVHSAPRIEQRKPTLQSSPRSENSNVVEHSSPILRFSSSQDDSTPSSTFESPVQPTHAQPTGKSPLHSIPASTTSSLLHSSPVKSTPAVIFRRSPRPVDSSTTIRSTSQLNNSPVDSTPTLEFKLSPVGSSPSHRNSSPVDSTRSTATPQLNNALEFRSPVEGFTPMDSATQLSSSPLNSGPAYYSHVVSSPVVQAAPHDQSHNSPVTATPAGEVRSLNPAKFTPAVELESSSGETPDHSSDLRDFPTDFTPTVEFR